ncbi:MAG: PAS domain S-box protein [Desulfobacterales bacterium]|jgi:PAS domain S-box-containing protein
MQSTQFAETGAGPFNGRQIKESWKRPAANKWCHMLEIPQNKPIDIQLEQRVKTLAEETTRLTAVNAELRRRNEYLTALHETAIGLLDLLDKEELLETILYRAALLSGTKHGYIYLLDPDGTCLQMLVGMGFFKGQLGRRVRLGEGMGGKVWQAEEPIAVDDYQLWPSRLPDSSLDPLGPVVGIPLKSEKGVLGVIGLARVEKGKRFREEDVTILGRFAELALLALEKAQLITDARHELKERVKTEAILRHSEQLYRSLLESSPDPVVVYDIEGRATHVNPAFERTFGFAREELLGRQIEFVPEENLPETRAAIESMLSGNTIQLFETKRLTKTGRVLDVQISSRLYNDRDGRPAGNIVILRDISAAKRVEEELRQYHDQLEELVAGRTAELAKTNARLAQEVEDRKRVEKKLRKREVELKAQSHHLAEVNTALKVLLKQREYDKKELADNVLSNVKALIGPYLERLQKSRLSTDQLTLINILESNLNNIISPFISRFSARNINLTPTEIRVANLVKEGKTNKEIAALLCLSKNTILFHRYNIRKKLGIKNKKINLQAHLLSFE